MDPIRVLHIDDDPQMTDLTATFLERENDLLTVETATSVAEGLSKLERKDIDCLVSDYDMPERNGIELLNAVRESRPNLPFILYTGKGSEEIASEAISNGATDYLQKQSGTEQYELLANRIRNAVEQNRAKRSQRWLGELAENTDWILYIFTADWTELLFINSAYEDNWDWARESLRENPRNFLDGIHPDDRDKVREAMATVSAGEASEVEFRVNTTEEDERWARGRGEPIFDESGEVVRVSGFVNEITEVKRRERELREANLQVRAATAAGMVGTWEWRIPENHVIADPKFARTFGIDLERARDGVPLEEFVDSIYEADRPRVEDSIEQAIEHREEYKEEFRVWNADDELRWVLTRGHVEFDDEGTPVTFPGAAVDITERKQYERQLEHKNDRLEDFTSIVSHDLRNPLNVATGRLELARQEFESEHLAEIESALTRMENLIDDLLALSQYGEEAMEIESVSVTPLLEDCWQAVETNRATLRLEVSGTIRADRSRVAQLFENLFRNAVEHGPEAVTVTVGSTEEGVYVEDDGPGIPAEKRDEVFDAGYTTADEGTGFGLSIVETVAHDHGWRVRISDGSDGGTRIEIVGLVCRETD